MPDKAYYPLPWEKREERENAGRYSEVLLGPGGFDCFLGEPEDRTWYRDVKPVVAELNRLHDTLEALRKYIRECLPDAPVPDELMGN